MNVSQSFVVVIGLAFAAGCFDSSPSTSPAATNPSYVVVWFDQDRSTVVKQGAMSARKHFVEFQSTQLLMGKRLPASGTVTGVLLAVDKTTLISVPIYTWIGQHESVHFLCQATEDATPPAISIYAASKTDMLAQIEATLDIKHESESDTR